MLFTSPKLLGQPATSSVQSRHSYLHQPQSLPHQQSSSFLHQPPIAATSSVSQGGFLLTSVPIATTSSSVQSFPNKNTWRECHKSFSVTWRTIFLHVSSGSLFQPRHVSQREEPSRQRNRLLFLLSLFSFFFPFSWIPAQFRDRSSHRQRFLHKTSTKSWWSRFWW